MINFQSNSLDDSSNFIKIDCSPKTTMWFHENCGIESHPFPLNLTLNLVSYTKTQLKSSDLEHQVYGAVFPLTTLIQKK